jgi:hypothetical protein
MLPFNGSNKINKVKKMDKPKNDVGYMSRLTGALKTAAVTGLAGLVLVSAAGCETAASRGGTLSVLKFEYGAKTTRSKDAAIQSQVINSDAKYEDTVSTVPGNGFGIRYRE